jgi:PIN domain nuclease of toxin-antitoxin system
VADGEIVVDASAVLALLQGEPFGKFDPERIVGAAISAVNLAEVLTKLLSAGLSRHHAEDAAAALNFRVVPFDKQQARDAAGLWPATSRGGLSLGDRACLALGLALKAPVITADRAWAKIDIGASIVLIR